MSRKPHSKKGERKIKIIVISGAQSGSGKTTLACALLPYLSNFAAIKITLHHDGTKVTDRKEEIMVTGKDTYRLQKGGASKVVWVQTTEEELPEAMNIAWKIIGNVEGIIIEGTSILNHLTPDLTFFVVDGDLTDLKPSRVSALKKAQVIIINEKEKNFQSENLEKTIRNYNDHALILSLNLEKDNSHYLLPLLNQYLGLPRHNPLHPLSQDTDRP